MSTTYEIFPTVTGPDNGYTVQSPWVPTYQPDASKHFINEVYAGVPAAKGKPRGYHHDNGTCGYMGSICGECYEVEVKWHKRIAELIAVKYPPLAWELGVDYWSRIRGRMCDTWPDAAAHAMKLADELRGVACGHHQHNYRDWRDNSVPVTCYTCGAVCDLPIDNCGRLVGVAEVTGPAIRA